MSEWNEETERAIEAALAAATPGPWAVYENYEMLRRVLGSAAQRVMRERDEARAALVAADALAEAADGAGDCALLRAQALEVLRAALATYRATRKAREDEA